MDNIPCWQKNTNIIRYSKARNETILRDAVSAQITQSPKGEKASARGIYSKLREDNTKQLKTAWPLTDNSPAAINARARCWLCGNKVEEEDLKNFAGIIQTKFKITKTIPAIASEFLGAPQAEHVLFLKLAYRILSVPGEEYMGEPAPWLPLEEFSTAKQKQEVRTNQFKLGFLKTAQDRVKDDEMKKACLPETVLNAMQRDYKAQIKMEMLQSHKLCNQLKNQLNFIRYNVETNKWVIKSDLVNDFLEKLNGVMEKGNPPQNPDRDVIDGYIGDLINYLNFEGGAQSPWFAPTIAWFPEHIQKAIKEYIGLDSDEKATTWWNEQPSQYKYIITRGATKFIFSENKIREFMDKIKPRLYENNNEYQKSKIIELLMKYGPGTAVENYGTRGLREVSQQISIQETRNDMTGQINKNDIECSPRGQAEQAQKFKEEDNELIDVLEKISRDAVLESNARSKQSQSNPVETALWTARAIRAAKRANKQNLRVIREAYDDIKDNENAILSREVAERVIPYQQEVGGMLGSGSGSDDEGGAGGAGGTDGKGGEDGSSGEGASGGVSQSAPGGEGASGGVSQSAPGGEVEEPISPHKRKREMGAPPPNNFLQHWNNVFNNAGIDISELSQVNN